MRRVERIQLTHENSFLDHENTHIDVRFFTPERNIHNDTLSGHRFESNIESRLDPRALKDDVSTATASCRIHGRWDVNSRCRIIYFIGATEFSQGAPLRGGL